MKKPQDMYYRDETKIEEKGPEWEDELIDDLSRKHAKFVREKKWGLDVREAIARAVEWFSILFHKTKQVADDSQKVADEVKQRQDHLEARWDEVINSEGVGYSEIIDARESEDGLTHKTLKERLKQDYRTLLNKIEVIYSEMISKFKQVSTDFNNHVNNKNNPHNVTAAQVNSFSKAEVEKMISDIESKIDQKEKKVFKATSQGANGLGGWSGNVIHYRQGDVVICQIAIKYGNYGTKDEMLHFTQHWQLPEINKIAYFEYQYHDGDILLLQGDGKLLFAGTKKNNYVAATLVYKGVALNDEDWAKNTNI